MRTGRHEAGFKSSKNLEICETVTTSWDLYFNDEDTILFPLMIHLEEIMLLQETFYHKRLQLIRLIQLHWKGPWSLGSKSAHERFLSHEPKIVEDIP